jgi:hypothetical protein
LISSSSILSGSLTFIQVGIVYQVDSLMRMCDTAKMGGVCDDVQVNINASIPQSISK